MKINNTNNTIKDNSDNPIVTASGIGAEETANKGVANGYAGLDGSSKVSQTNLTLDEGYIYGCNVTGNHATQTATISAGRARSAANDADIVVSSPLTVTMTTTGANGRDTGSAVNGAWHIWVIRKSSDGTVAALASLSSTSPTMPSGYDQKRRVGCIAYVSSAVVGTKQYGHGSMRETQFTATVNPSGTFSSTNTSAFDLSSYIPATAHLIQTNNYHYSAANGSYYYNMSFNNAGANWGNMLALDANAWACGSQRSGTIAVVPGGTRVFGVHGPNGGSGTRTIGIIIALQSYSEEV